MLRTWGRKHGFSGFFEFLILYWKNCYFFGHFGKKPHGFRGGGGTPPWIAKKPPKPMLRTWIFWKKPPNPCFEHGFFGKNHQNHASNMGFLEKTTKTHASNMGSGGGVPPPGLPKSHQNPCFEHGFLAQSGFPGDPGLANWGTLDWPIGGPPPDWPIGEPGLANWGIPDWPIGEPWIGQLGNPDWPIGEPWIGQLGNPIWRPWEPSEIGFQKPHFSIEKIAIFNTNPLSQVRIAGLSKIGGFGSNYLR